jgi:O-acetyl-ADP-ribose deacetylase (regulator of RNase III)
MTKTLTGDLIQLGLDGYFDVILQGCNCFNQMGKGLGLTMKQKLPEVYEVDCQTVKGDKNKLGTISYVTLSNTPLTVVNCYTQYQYNSKTVDVLTEYWTIEPCLTKVKELFTGKKIGYPMIGCGLGGGDWNTVYTIIKDTLQGEDHTLVLYNK